MVSEIVEQLPQDAGRFKRIALEDPVELFGDLIGGWLLRYLVGRNMHVGLSGRLTILLGACSLYSCYGWELEQRMEWKTQNGILSTLRDSKQLLR